MTTSSGDFPIPVWGWPPIGGVGGGVSMTPLRWKAIVIIRSSNGQNIASHLLEYANSWELENAVAALAQWAGYYEVIRL